MSSQDNLSLSVSFKGKAYPIVLPSDSTVAALQDLLEELTTVPSPLQKLLYKGKSKEISGETILTQAGLKNGMKIQMLGTTTQQIAEIQSAENSQQKRERILRERAKMAPVKVRSTGGSNSSLLAYRFHKIVELPHLPNPSGARAILQRLADDPAVQHIMQLHKFSVGTLTELAPHEHPELLGLNTNGGEKISIRLRTMDYLGHRTYSDILQILCHELTHNVFGDHDNKFKELNSQLNKEIVAFKTARANGTHYLSTEDVYEPEEADNRATVTAHVLGGSSAPSSSPETAADRRRRILEATLARLQKEEKIIEDSCGTAGPSTMM